MGWFSDKDKDSAEERIKRVAREGSKKEIDNKINDIDKLIANEKNPKTKDALRESKERLIRKRKDK